MKFHGGKGNTRNYRWQYRLMPDDKDTLCLNYINQNNFLIPFSWGVALANVGVLSWSSVPFPHRHTMSTYCQICWACRCLQLMYCSMHWTKLAAGRWCWSARWRHLMRRDWLYWTAPCLREMWGRCLSSASRSDSGGTSWVEWSAVWTPETRQTTKRLL